MFKVLFEIFPKRLQNSKNVAILKVGMKDKDILFRGIFIEEENFPRIVSFLLYD